MKTIATKPRMLSLSLFAAVALLAACASSSEPAPEAVQGELSVDGDAAKNTTSSDSETKNNSALNTSKSNSALDTAKNNSELNTSKNNSALNTSPTSNSLSNSSLENAGLSDDPPPLTGGLNDTANTFDPNQKPINGGTNSSGLGMLGNTNSLSTTPTNSSNPQNSTGLGNSAGSPPVNAMPTNAPLNVASSSNTLLPSNTAIPPINAAPESVPTATTPAESPLSTEDLEYWKTAAQRLRNIAPEEAPSEYTVQPGDTLWDIADQLVDDYRWWPKLWVINPTIANPNRIYPGQKLVFLPSTGGEAPALLVKDLGTATPVSPTAIFVTQRRDLKQDEAENGLLLDPSQLGTDPSLEVYSEGRDPSGIPIQIPGFLAGSSPDSVGKIVKKGPNGRLVPKGALAYAELDAPASPGQRFLAVREAERGLDPEGNSAFGPNFYVYSGILGLVNTHKSGIASLLVEESQAGVLEDDILIPFRNISPIIDPTLNGNKANLKAQVLAIENEYRSLTTVGGVVILEKNEGSANPGDLIELFMPAGGTTNFESDGLDAVLVARARVLEVTDESISALILAGSREVPIGARTWPEF
jgi:hypothetical protein